MTIKLVHTPSGDRYFDTETNQYTSNTPVTTPTTYDLSDPRYNNPYYQPPPGENPYWEQVPDSSPGTERYATIQKNIVEGTYFTPAVNETQAKIQFTNLQNQGTIPKTATYSGYDAATRTITYTIPVTQKTKITGIVVGYGDNKIALEDKSGKVHWIKSSDEEVKEAKNLLSAKSLVDNYDGRLQAALRDGVSEKTLHDAGYSLGAITAAKDANNIADVIQKDFDNNTVKLDNGEIVNKTTWNKLPADEKKYLKENGVDNYNRVYGSVKPEATGKSVTDILYGPKIEIVDNTKLNDTQALILGAAIYKVAGGDKKLDKKSVTDKWQSLNEEQKAAVIRGVEWQQQLAKAGGDKVTVFNFNKPVVTENKAIEPVSVASFVAVTQQIGTKGGNPMTIPLIVAALVAGGYTVAQAGIKAKELMEQYQKESKAVIQPDDIYVINTDTGQTSKITALKSINNIDVQFSPLTESQQKLLSHKEGFATLSESQQAALQKTEGFAFLSEGQQSSINKTEGFKHLTPAQQDAINAYETMPMQPELAAKAGGGTVTWREPVVFIPGPGVKGTPIPKSALDSKSTLQKWMSSGQLFVATAGTQEALRHDIASLEGTITDLEHEAEAADGIADKATQNTRSDTGQRHP